MYFVFVCFLYIYIYILKHLHILTLNVFFLPLFRFINKTAPADLEKLPRCSKKIAETIISLRPFSSWEDLVSVVGVGPSLARLLAYVLGLM
jgi:hypothetical protein